MRSSETSPCVLPLSQVPDPDEPERKRLKQHDENEKSPPHHSKPMTLSLLPEMREMLRIAVERCMGPKWALILEEYRCALHINAKWKSAGPPSLVNAPPSLVLRSGV